MIDKGSEQDPHGKGQHEAGAKLDMQLFNLWASWTWAIIRFDLKKAKELADDITRKQKGKPPVNHGNLGG